MKGWFRIKGVQDGDRTLDEQLTGLPVKECARGSILDLGSAEGLIARHLIESGAGSVDCVEYSAAACDVARQVLEGHPARVFHRNLCEDLDALGAELRPAYDVVLLLSVLHKLSNPESVMRMAIAKSPRLIVVRLPGVTGSVVVNKFTKERMCDVRDVLTGFTLETAEGPFGEWTGIFRRTSTQPST